ncbi:MAG: ribonuclease HII [Nitrospirae bacterium]|nr:ribonuclease HII [Nitrospirota bacterium]
MNASGALFQFDETVRRDYPVIAGLDEAGRGPLAGPVVAGAVILPSGCIIEGIKDSKLTTLNERLRLFNDITANAVAIGIGIVDADAIDRINILQSTYLAMKSALHHLKQILFIDAVRLPGIEIPQKSIIKGESVSASIAAASIIAKVTRDGIMDFYHEKYPLYNFGKHKGYGTKEHISLIRAYGPCPIHRKSFRKVIDVELPLA